jgi:hypothetical protein
MLSLLYELSDGLVLMDRPERIALERTAARRLETADALQPWRHSQRSWERLDARLAWDARMHRALRKEQVTGERSATWFAKRMRTVRRKLGGKGVASARTKEWYRQTPDLVADWARDFTLEGPVAKRLAPDGRGWPSPDEIPSLWNYVAFQLSYIFLVNTRAIPPDRGDRGDVALYSEAAYADVLVTNDRNMRRVIENIRGPRVRVQTIQEFVEDWAARTTRRRRPSQ